MNCFLADVKVFPACVSLSFKTAPISPAIISETSFLFLPFTKYNCLNLSVTFLLVFVTSFPVDNFPEHTLKKESSPTCSSLNVLKTYALSSLSVLLISFEFQFVVC